METTDQSTSSERQRLVEFLLTPETAVDGASSVYKFRNGRDASIQPIDGKGAMLYLRNVLTDEEIDLRLNSCATYANRFYDAMVLTCQPKPPKPSAITPEIPMIETKDPFPDIPASGATERPNLPVGVTDKEYQRTVISHIKNCYIRNDQLVLVTVGRGKHIRREWRKLDCKVCNQNLVPKGTNRKNLQTPVYSDGAPVPDNTQSLIRQAYTIYDQEQFASALSMIFKKPPQYESELCHLKSCINLAHRKLETKETIRCREECFSGSLCDCPNEFKCLTAGHKTRRKKHFFIILVNYTVVCSVMAILTTVKNLSTETEVFGWKKFSYPILDVECETPGSSSDTTNYLAFENRVANKVNAESSRIKLYVAEDPSRDNSQVDDETMDVDE